LSEVDKMWELQTVLSALNDRERQMALKPDDFAEVEREWLGASEEATRLQQQKEGLEKDKRRVDGELSDQQELLKKYQGQLMQVKNQQQYAAAWKEIDATRKHVKELEDSSLKSMGEIDEIDAKLEAGRASHGDLQSRYDAAHAEWQNSLGDLRKEAEELRKKADAIEATLSPRMRAEFQKIYRQRQQVAIAKVGVGGDTCTMCRNRVRPQVAQQLKRGELVHCEGCHRILYLERPTS
jgi:predicted  nucleic acid-binding Zn-ribbon protein